MKRRYIGSIVGFTILLTTIAAIFSLTSTLMTVYNTMVKSKVQVEQSLSDLESVYQRRYALIDNLIVLVKETRTFEKYQIEIEKDLYPRVAEAKAQATKLDIHVPQTVQQRIKKESQLNNSLLQTLDKLLVLAPHYPTIPDPVLKDRLATFEALKGLKTSLQELELDVQEHRQAFNHAVASYNQNIQIFPANFFAQTWGFTPLRGFEVRTPEVLHDAKIAF